MRVSAISAFTKNVTTRTLLTTGAATLALSAALPLLPGTSAAWACGDDEDVAASVTAPQAPESPVKHNGEVVAGFFMLRPGPLAMTAGGAKLDLPVELGTTSDAPYEDIKPVLSLYNENKAGAPLPLANLRTEDLTVDVNIDGSWKHLPLRHGCDPVIYADKAVPSVRVPKGRAVHLTFRIGISAKAPKGQTTIQVGVSGNGGNGWYSPAEFRDVQVLRPHPAPPMSSAPAAPKPAPSTPKAAPTEAAVPAAEVTARTATPTTAAPAAAAPQPAAELAQTGGGAHSGFLVGSAAACLALGAGVLYAVRRRARH